MGITLDSLKKGVAALGLEVSSNKKKDLEAAIDAHLADQELGYECPSCSKDIPDVEECPYCGESFVEEVEEVEETEAVEAVDSDEDEDEEINAEVDTDPDEEDAPKTSTKGKGKGTKKDSAPKEHRGRPTGKTKSTEEKEKEFAALVEAIDGAIGDGFEKRERKTGITYVKDGKRLLKAVITGKSLSVEYNVEIASEDENLTKFTEEEAKAKHLGSTRAVYALGTAKLAAKFAKEALKNFS